MHKRPSNYHLVTAEPLPIQIRPWLTIVRVYKLYLLTYLLTYNVIDLVHLTESRKGTTHPAICCAHV